MSSTFQTSHRTHQLLQLLLSFGKVQNSGSCHFLQACEALNHLYVHAELSSAHKSIYFVHPSSAHTPSRMLLCLQKMILEILEQTRTWKRKDTWQEQHAPKVNLRCKYYAKQRQTNQIWSRWGPYSLKLQGYDTNTVKKFVDAFMRNMNVNPPS